MIPTTMEPGTSRRADGSSAAKAAAQDAIDRSRAFLRERLTPDLQAAETHLASLTSDRTAYIDLARALRKRRDEAKEAPQGSTTTNAPLGYGAYVPVVVQNDARVIVNLGLAQSSSTALSASLQKQQDASTDGRSIDIDKLPNQRRDAGLYAELTTEEALGYIQKKVPVLDKKIKIAQEKIASIQGHIELTTRSIEQLEVLQGSGNASFLDLLATV